MTVEEIAALPPADAEQLHLVDEIEHEKDYDAIHSKAFAERCGEGCACQPITIAFCTMPEEAGQ